MVKFTLEKVLSASLMSVLGLAATSANATIYNFDLSGNGITASGQITATPSPLAGTYEVQSISGSFADSNVGISGSITGLETCSFSDITPPFVPAGHSDAGFSFDNLYYPAGDSPLVCSGYPFDGGVFDVYGVLFDVMGGYQVDLWSNGVLPFTSSPDYALGDSQGTNILDYNNGNGVNVNVNTSVAPGPDAALLPAVFALGALARKRRKRQG